MVNNICFSSSIIYLGNFITKISDRISNKSKIYLNNQNVIFKKYNKIDPSNVQKTPFIYSFLLLLNTYKFVVNAIKCLLFMYFF